MKIDLTVITIVILVIWLGIVSFIIYVNKRLQKLESELQELKDQKSE